MHENQEAKVFVSLKNIKLINNIITDVFIDGVCSGFVVRFKIREKEFVVCSGTHTDKPRIFRTLKAVFRFVIDEIKSKKITVDISNYRMSKTDAHTLYSRRKTDDLQEKIIEDIIKNNKSN
jgi:hypothetical protein